PGFIDTHVHLTSTGLALANEDVAGARSGPQLLAIAAERARRGAEAALVLQGFDETLWDAPGLPSLAELDAAVSGPLVIRRVDGHVALANSAALVAAAVADADGVERDVAGEPTGVVTREANARLG